MPLLPHHGVLPDVHPSAFIAEGAWVVGDVRIGSEAGIWFNAVLRGDINSITVGDRSNVQDGVVVHVTKKLPVIIGNEVTVGHMAMLHGCVINDRVLIGMNAVVLDRAVVEADTIVAAGAVVREGFTVPTGMLVAGVPAKVVREITPEERAFLRTSADNYVGYAKSYR
jgi:carbonic anhydrase/acetyltransferase-like protein (isoleucine patch superfamily)